MKLTESHLRNLIKQELKEMMGSESSLDDQLYDFLDKARIGGRYPLAKLAQKFNTTPEAVRQAFEEGGDMFRPYGYWCTLEGDVIVKDDDSEAA